MEKRLKSVLQNCGENYILPFYWQHGESKELLEEGMEKIYESGIGAVCVESRPHPDFLGESWWRDLDIIMTKAKELNMKVWVLDDAHFPSGYCNGQVGENSPYAKVYLTHYTIDVVGPVKGNAFMVKVEPDERLIGITMSKRSRKESFYQTDICDLTGKVEAGKVYVDIPEGSWAITVMKAGPRGSGRKGYINPLNAEAVRFFIDTVYEAHFQRYEADFGDTFAGFFSDEPEIGNCVGEYIHDSYIGQPTMSLPWGEELEKKLRKLWREKFASNLLAMWVNVDAYVQEGVSATERVSSDSTQKWDYCEFQGFSDNRPEWNHVQKGWSDRPFMEQRKATNHTGLLRRQFMELVSELYGKNFTGQIGDWCRAHHVEYIGHVIEDGGTHSHLGLGTGHFFKALMGQDMSGIDVVLQQIRPQLDDYAFYSVGGRGFYHGELFHYGLAKLGTSLGHLDSKKKGRTMCEVFGAYGWAEGLKQMKWIMDHMLVRGVNHYVPHAFTMKDFPDLDCPPHFYARGRNPQFPYFRYLMEYTNRVSHLISGGKHVPSVALLYTAEQEWMGSVRKFEKDAKELTRGQIDFEVVPEEILLKAQMKDGMLQLGEEAVTALVVPGSYCITEELAQKCQELAAEGLLVVVTENLEYILKEDGNLEKIPETEQWARPIKADRLVNYLRERACFEVEASEYQPWLRYYHYRQDGGEYYLFFHEAVTESCDTNLHVPNLQGELWWYDPWTNKLTKCEKKADGTIQLSLSPYEMKILYVGDIAEELQQYVKQSLPRRESQVVELTEGPWKIRLGSVGKTIEESCEDETLQVLGDISRSDRFPHFSGKMTYSTTFVLPEECPDSDGYCLDLGEVYETAQVKINGMDAGVRIAPPYRFDITELVKAGENTLEILVTNTLVNELRDYFSMTMPMEPSGLLGPVRIV